MGRSHEGPHLDVDLPIRKEVLEAELGGRAQLLRDDLCETGVEVHALLGEVSPEQKRDALLVLIEDNRNHLRLYPASCSARERREEAFKDLYELMQGEFNPVSVAECAIILYAIEKGSLEECSDERRTEFSEGIYEFASQSDSQLLTSIEKVQELTPEIETGIQKVIGDFEHNFDLASVNRAAKVSEGTA